MLLPKGTPGASDEFRRMVRTRMPETAAQAESDFYEALEDMQLVAAMMYQAWVDHEHEPTEETTQQVKDLQRALLLAGGAYGRVVIEFGAQLDALNN